MKYNEYAMIIGFDKQALLQGPCPMNQGWIGLQQTAQNSHQPQNSSHALQPLLL